METTPARDPRFVPLTMTARSELNASGAVRLAPDAFAFGNKTTP